MKRYATYYHVKEVSCGISQTSKRCSQTASYDESNEHHVSTACMFDNDRHPAAFPRRSENVDNGSAPAAVFTERQADSAARRRLQETQ